MQDAGILGLFAKFRASIALCLLALLMSLSLPSCQFIPTVPIAAMSPEAQRVSQALAVWPEIDAGSPPLNRPFFATIHIMGRRVTASGVLQYHSPRDFRITAVTEMGVILFDARMNWAGVTALRQMPGLDKSMVESLISDLSKAFQLPDNLEGLAEKGNFLVLKRIEADTNKYTWLFDPASGRLRETDVDISTFDTLKIEYPRYNVHGWPEELTVTRKARFYMINLSFTDSAMAKHNPQNP
jgi:hypothetical protein